MKKLLLGLVAFGLLATGAYACQTQTIIVNGKITTCTICGNVVNCFQKTPGDRPHLHEERQHPFYHAGNYV